MEHPPTCRRILVALDGSALAEQILEPAQRLGELTQAEYTLLHVVEPHTFVRSAPFTAPTGFDAEDTQQRQMEAQRYLEHIAESRRAEGVSVGVDVRIDSECAQ